ncbi:MAG: macro domain-containing protein [Xanthobacteraceae bacterium]|nr:macro domain-containing protein [Xanthobacteraceae bacterium]
MLDFQTGNIFDSGAEALVNTVNCVGVMGRGVALQFKNNYPDNFKAYAAACARGEVQPGRMFVIETGHLTHPKWIINFPTKRHWRGKSRLEDIESGLRALKQEIVSRDIKSIALPPLGSGLGGLPWQDVRKSIEHALGELNNVRIIVFEPHTVLTAQSISKNPNAPSMTPGRAALVGLMHQYLSGLLDPFVTLLEVHKLMYFMQEAGQPLKLNYVKAPFGPYAENLRHVLRSVEGYFVSGYADGGDAPNKQLELVPGAITDAESLLADDLDTRSRFDRVTKLVEGFETPFGLELLATVHWLTRYEGAAAKADAVARTYSWGERKKRFSERQIGLAYDRLEAQGWLH